MAGLQIPLDEVVHFDVITNSSTGAAVDADAAPTFSVFEEATDAAIVGPSNMTKRTDMTGNYRGTFTVSEANTFEVGKWYSVVASGTVSAVAGKCVCLNFRVVAAEAVVGTPKVDLNTAKGRDVGDVGVGNTAHLLTAAISSMLAQLTAGTPSGKVVDDASNSATTFETDLASTTDDFAPNGWLLFTSGDLQAQTQPISDYNGTTKFVTVSTAFTAEPTADDEFVIIGRKQ